MKGVECVPVFEIGFNNYKEPDAGSAMSFYGSCADRRVLLIRPVCLLTQEIVGFIFQRMEYSVYVGGYRADVSVAEDVLPGGHRGVGQTLSNYL